MKPDVWDQLKGITSRVLMSALESDGWVVRSSGGSAVVYKKGNLRVSIHSHHHKTYGSGQLKDSLRDIGWTEADFKRLKLINKILQPKYSRK